MIRNLPLPFMKAFDNIQVGMFTGELLISPFYSIIKELRCLFYSTES